MTSRTVLVALAAAGLALTACSGGSAPADQAVPPSADATGTLTVWLMEDGQPQTVVDAVNAEFAKTFPKVTVEVQLQQWGGIQDTLMTALSTDATPDVVQIGSSATARFADAGLLAALDAQAFDVEEMLPGAQPSGELDGTRYGIAYFGGVRVVVYKKSDFEQAGVQEPTTLAEFETVAGKLQAAHADNDAYSAFYFPGRDWIGALPFVWDAGGEIARQDGDRWTGTLDSAQAMVGLTTLQGLVDKYSKAPVDADELKNIEAFATGDVGMMLDAWWAPGALDTADLEGDIGAFALPGTTPETTAPVYFAGSDLAVAERSANKGLGVEWIKILTGSEIQTQLAQEGGVIPNQEKAFSGHEGNPFLRIADEAATASRFTPVTPQWGTVESAGILPDMLESIFTGRASVEEATRTASEAITTALNG